MINFAKEIATYHDSAAITCHRLLRRSTKVAQKKQLKTYVTEN